MEGEAVETIGGWFLIFVCWGFVYGIYYFSVVRQPPRPLEIEYFSRWFQSKLFRRIFSPKVVVEHEFEPLDLSKADLESSATTAVTGFGIDEDD